MKILSEFFAINISTRSCQKKIDDHETRPPPKKRIQTAITKSVFDRQHSCWHRLEAATTAHPAILTLLVSTPYIRSSCLPSAAEVAWKILFWAICRPHTLSTSSPFTQNQHLQSQYPLSPIDLRLRKFGRSSPFQGVEVGVCMVTCYSLSCIKVFQKLDALF